MRNVGFPWSEQLVRTRVQCVVRYVYYRAVCDCASCAGCVGRRGLAVREASSW